MIVGEFDVAGVIEAPISELWRKTSAGAGITQAVFQDYFRGRESGFAIQVGSVRIFDEPIDLANSMGLKAPQSFLYLN